MEPAEYNVKINTNFDTSEIMKSLSGIQKVADDGIKNIAQSVMNDLSSVCKYAMDQITKTMKENLSNDLTDLNSALGGIGTVIYEKFSDPIQESIQTTIEYVDELTQNIVSGELSESLSKIASGFGEISSEVLNFAGNNVMPALITGFEVLVDHADELKVIIGLVAAEFVAFKTAAVISSVVDSINKANRAMALLEAETSITAFQQVALASGMSLSEIAVGLYTGQLKLATVAQAAFNTIVKANPVLLITSAIAVAAVAIVTIVSKLRNLAEETDKVMERMQNAIDETTNHIESMNGEYNTNIERIKQLQELRATGRLTASDEQELTNLEAENRLLEAQIKLEERKLQAMKDEAELIALDTLGGNANVEGSVDNVLFSLNKYLDDLAEYKQKHAQYIQEIADQYDIINDETGAYSEENKLNATWRANKIAEKLREMEKAQAKYEEETRAQIENSVDAMNEMAGALQGVTEESVYMQNMVSGVLENVSSSLYGTHEELQEIISESAEVKLGVANHNIGTKTFNEDLAEKRKSEAIASENARTDALKSEWERLNHKYAVGEIESEEALYAKKQEIWEKYGNKNNKDHWRYYEELYKHEQDSAERRKQAAEDAEKEIAETQKQEMQDKWDTISKLEALGLKTSEDAYKEQLNLIKEYCPEYSDEWYSYYKTIVDYQRNALKEQVQDVKDSISDIVSEYQTAYAEIENSVNSYKNKLLSVGSVFSVVTEADDEGNETKNYTVENLTEQMDKMQKYHDMIMNLKERGVSNEVLSELTTLDFDDGMFFAENLAGSSDAELKKISKLYAEKEKLAESLANELYAPEMDKLNTDLINGVIDQFGTLPDEIRAIGGEAINSFVMGLLDNNENLTEAAQKFMDNFFTACDEGISSGSFGMENVGENIAAILGEPDTYSIGLEMGHDLVNGLNDALSSIQSQLMTAQANVSAELAIGQAQSTQGSYAGSSWSGSGKGEKIVLENHEDITVKVDREVLGKTMREYTRLYERSTGT